MEIPWEKISIAPMMDITDRRFRYFMRLINPRVALAQHFNTFPPIRQDGKAWADRVCKDLRVEVPFLQPGEAANV